MARQKITKEQAYEKLLSYKHNIEYLDFFDIYDGSRSRVKALCPVHGEFERRYDQFTENSGCPSCKHIESNSDEFLSYMSDYYPDIDLSFVEFKTVRVPVILKHPQHGEISRTPESIYKSNSINFNGVRVKAKKSVIEQASIEAHREIEKCLIESGVEYIKDYEFNGYTISFYIPSRSYGVNFNSTTKGLDRNYNYNLWKEFNDANITVFNMYDFYWVLPEKKPIILSKIKHGLGLDRKIYARKCRVGVDEVSLAQCKQLLNRWHIEGAGFFYKNSKVFSLHLEDEIVMIAVVGQYYEQGSNGKFVNKLSRIATKLGVTVVGGISKLTKEIAKGYGDFNYLITLSSGGRSLSSSKEYRLISPRYFWVDPNTLKSYPRNACQKSVLEKNFGVPLFDVTDDKGRTRVCTEKEYMESLGYVRVFDNGLAEIFLDKDIK